MRDDSLRNLIHSEKLQQANDTTHHSRHLPNGVTLKTNTFLAIGFSLGLGALTQANSQTAAAVKSPTFRVVVISRSVEAVNYQHRGGATKLDFAGTALMPTAAGQAEIATRHGAIEIKAELMNLQKPASFGGEYLTYVLWAISPEGRAINLGELAVNDDQKSKLTVTTDLQAFALIITAEPYYAVRQPSNVVVLENVVRADTRGTSEAVKAKYELMERGGYIPTGYQFDPVVRNARLPLEFFEARNALRIAKSEGAEMYASDSYQHALQLMSSVEAHATKKHVDNKALIAVAREEVQTAEDAREIAVKKMDETRRASEQQASAAALVQSQAQASEADRQKQQAQTDMATNQAASAAEVARAQADAERSRLAAQQANQSAQQAETDKGALRARLSEQLNSILQTRDSARGLIVSMSDVLFATGKYSLMPGAREKLAKVAGILLAYPGLSIEVGGYTDNIGGDAMNQELSENRAGSVRDYLLQEGVTANSVSAKGFGNSLPVASNGDSSGRQQNRRVELVVSGDAIGSPGRVSTGSL
jgi:outer membrane protein OmpA-like peptidoglycan-associated protein